MVDVFIRLALLFLLFFAVVFLLQKIAAKKMSEKLFLQIRAPAFVFIAIFFLSWALKLLQSVWDFEVHSFTIGTFRSCAFLAVFCWLYTRLKSFYLGKLLEKFSDQKSSLYRETVEVAGNVFSALIYIATFFALLQISGINIVPFMTFGGLGIAALGISSKDIMTNFFAGLGLKITTPFKEGELVEIPDKKVSGIVQKMGWFTTRLVDEKCRLVTVPNVMFSSCSLINASRHTHFVFNENFDVGAISLPQALALEERIVMLLRSFPGIDPSKSFSVTSHISLQRNIKIEVVAYFLRKKMGSFAAVRNALIQDILEKISS